MSSRFITFGLGGTIAEFNLFGFTPRAEITLPVDLYRMYDVAAKPRGFDVAAKVRGFDVAAKPRAFDVELN